MILKIIYRGFKYKKGRNETEYVAMSVRFNKREVAVIEFHAANVYIYSKTRIHLFACTLTLAAVTESPFRILLREN